MENNYCVGLEYFNGALDDNDVSIIANELKRYEIELLPRAFLCNASIDFLVPLVNIILTEPCVSAIATGVFANMTWDGIKKLIMLVHDKLQLKHKEKTNMKNAVDKNQSIHITVGDNSLVLPTELDEKTLESITEKFLTCVKPQKIHERTFMFYSKKTGNLLIKTESEIIYEEIKKSNGNS